MAIVRFNGARVENTTSCNIIIMPCGIRIPSGGYKQNVRCNSDQVYSDLYETFYQWNSSATLNSDDIGVFYFCSAQEVKLRIIRTCPKCLEKYEVVLSGQARRRR